MEGKKLAHHCKEAERRRLQRRALELAVRRGKMTSTLNGGRHRHVKRKAYELDFDTLDCPICLEPLSPPVYQCKNGHIICAPCSEKLKQGCPSCSKPTGRIRNIAIEKIMESLEVSCKHADHGCQEVLKFSKQRDHEEHLCKYRPYLCPVPHCQHKCPKSEMPLHFEEEHRARTVMVGEGMQNRVTMMHSDHYVILQDGKRLFLVHHECWGSLGHIFFCSAFETSNRICQLGIVWPGDHIKEYSMNSRMYDNQREEGSVLKVKERGDYLLVPQGLHPQAQISEFEVRITIFSEDQNALQLVET